MVIFGLAPSQKFIEEVVQTYSEKVLQPSFHFNVDTKGMSKYEEMLERRKVKPFNDHFVYRLLSNGKLEISHLSLETWLDLRKMSLLSTAPLAIRYSISWAESYESPC